MVLNVENHAFESGVLEESYPFFRIELIGIEIERINCTVSPFTVHYRRKSEIYESVKFCFLPVKLPF